MESNNTSSVGDRVRWARQRSKLNQSELGRKAGVTRSAINQLEGGWSKSPTPKTLFKIASALGVSAKWLVDGRGLPEGVQEVKVEDSRLDYAHVPFIETTMLTQEEETGGKDMIFWRARPTNPLTVPAFILAEIGLETANAAAYTVQDDSMAPKLARGDVAILDTSAKRIKSGKIFVILFAGELVARRTIPQVNGGVILKADSELDAPLSVEPDQMHMIEVIGQVKFRWGSSGF